MQSCFQAADYLLSRAAAEGKQDAPDLMTNLKLQKLLYYAQGFSLAIAGHRLFPEDVVAWQYGPVVPEVWRKFRDYEAKPIPEPKSLELDGVAAQELELLEDVYSVYGQFSAWKLRDLTHTERPWIETPQSEPISDSLMTEFFKTLVAA